MKKTQIKQPRSERPQRTPIGPLLMVFGVLVSGCKAGPPPPPQQGRIHAVECVCSDVTGAAQLSLSVCLDNAGGAAAVGTGASWLCRMSELQIEARTRLNAICDALSVSPPGAVCSHPGDSSIVALRR